MKRILFLTHYFPPEVNAPANRTYEHCRLWVKDANVTVITNFPNHPEGRLFPGYKNRLIQKETIEGIKVVRLLTIITPNEGFLLRTFNYIFFMLISVLYVTISNLKFDVVIATTPQFFCGLAGKYISKIRRKPFILELRDLWPESIIAVGALKNKAVISFLERMEMKLYKSTNKIISVTVSFKEKLVSRNIDGNKIEIIYNGVSLELFSNHKEIADKDLSAFLESGFKIGYIGTIGMAHSIITLVNAAEKLRDNDIKFAIVGSGAEKKNIEDEIKSRNLKNIRIFPLQPKEEIPSIIEKLNVFCVHLKKKKLFETVIPSKLFEGMIMKKPILIGVDGESRKIIEDSKSGIYFEPENADDLIEKILQLKNNPNLLEKSGFNGFNLVTKEFNRKIIAEKYLNIIMSCLE